jgi:hypothetical protein
MTLAGLMLAGCHDPTHPPPRVVVPGEDYRQPLTRADDVKPMPPIPPGPGEATNYPQPYNDEPLLVQRPPEQRAFADAYNRVGHPRIAIFVNRTLNGQVVPVIDNRPLGEVEQHPLNTNGPVVVEQQTTTNGRTQTQFTQPGQYDEASAKTLDYEAMENILTDWLAANGQVTVVSPTLARARLTKDQIAKLEAGEALVLSDISQRLDADIFVQVQAHPTRQSYGPAVRLVAEAINVRGGQSLGRAVVDVPPPLDKNQLNKYTRFMARKLMDDMTGAWLSAPPPRAAPAAPAPH